MIKVSNKQQTTNNKPELMSPAGDRTMLTAVVKAGANAVYFGVDKLNMRNKAANFKIDELHEAVSFCKKHNVKTYLTLNTIVFEEELDKVDEIISAAKKSGVDRIICWDLAVAEKCKKHKIPFCISTQASVSNSLSANFYKSIGASRIVLARECSLEEIKKIRKNTDLETEAFIHGAMCVAVSGRCFMSHHLFGKSANRGDCIQPCRREYEVYDLPAGRQGPIIKRSMLIGEDYVLSAKDLCTIEFIDELIAAGINSFKIEGRKRSSEYAAKVTSVYRRAIDLYFEGKLTAEAKKNFLKELEEVYNRGFSSGFYFGKPSSEDYADIYGSKATTKKEYIGKVLNYYKRSKIVYIKLETGKLKLDDNIMIIGPTSGVVNLQLEKILIEEENVNQADRGDKITFPCPDLVRHNDTVYLISRFNTN
ncbi:MAG: protease [Ignavibacteria bacterium RBG_16_34_14]|nr:MAG: protease [Ignavibacteria bacterium RBG_16_34_14]